MRSRSAVNSSRPGKRLPETALAVALGWMLFCSGCGGEPGAKGPPATDYSREAIRARLQEQKSRMVEATALIEKRTGSTKRKIMLKASDQSQQKFEPPFFIIVKDRATVLGSKLARNKALETQKLDEAKTLLILEESINEVGNYVSGPFDITTGTAVEYSFIATVIDLSDPWRSRKLTYFSGAAQKIGYGTAEEQTSPTRTRGFTLSNKPGGKVLDDVLDAVVDLAGQPDYELPGEKDIKPQSVKSMQ